MINFKGEDLTNKSYGTRKVLKFVHFKPRNRGSKIPYWLCKCTCGHFSTICSFQVKQGRPCRYCRKVPSLPYGESAFNRLFSIYKRNAWKRNLLFDLKKHHFKQLTSSNCFYCNQTPSQKVQNKRGNGAYIYNGVDRKDNLQGYTIDNCVSCCSICNNAKRNFTFSAFITWIKALALYSQSIHFQYGRQKKRISR